MKGGFKVLMCVTTFLMVSSLTACGSSKSVKQRPSTNYVFADEPIPPGAKMSRAAIDSCHRAGGKITFAHGLDGTSIGMCQLVDGRRCAEWALMQGACPR